MSYQHALSEFILHGDSSSLDQLFDGSSDLSIASIYRNGFFRSCREALVSTFPTVQQFIGEDFFTALAHAFIKEYPPKQATLTGYGQQFPEWLEKQPLKENEILSQIAKLDWSWLACLHGKDAQPLTAEMFQQHMAANADADLPKVSVLSNMQFLQASKKAWHAWLETKQQLSDNKPLERADGSPEFVIMWRPNMEVLARALTAEEFCFIEAISRSQDLNKASEYVLNEYPDFDLPQQFSALLHNCLLSIN